MNPTHIHNMATLTASLERSLRNCSLNDSPAGRSSSNSARRRFIPSLISPDSSSSSSNSTLVELNSHSSLPYHWEQCLDLKTGEIYYVNWRSGKKAKEDPRLKTTAGGYNNYYSDDEDEQDDDANNVVGGGSYDSEGSSAAGYSSSESSMESYRAVWKSSQRYGRNPDDVLVVAGCKGCLMYHMVPKHVEECPKCSGHLLHFDMSSSSSSSDEVSP